MKISGYLTTRNCIEMNYPFVECIKSMLDFCDEVIVADSTDHRLDTTQEILEQLMEKHDKLSVVHVDVDYSVPNNGIWDGKMKAIARAQCTGDYLVQMDSDEVFPLGIRGQLEQVIKLTLEANPDLNLLALPVVEYWGSKGKVRVDVNPWKWRVSKNHPDITHGIPVHLRKWEAVNGETLLFAQHGTDGCDYIWKSSGLVVPCGNFYTNEVDQVRRNALQGNVDSLALYEQWFNKCVVDLPSVYHFSWWSVYEKIKKFKHTWNAQWLSLYNDTSTKNPQEWNPFFEQPLNKVESKQIMLYSKIIEENTGGHIFHNKWDYKVTPSVSIAQPVPTVIEPWLKSIYSSSK